MSAIGLFTDEMWEKLSESIAKAFSLDANHLDRIRKNSVMKLVGALPFLAECEEPERIAISHLGTFILASSPATKAFFWHNQHDSKNLQHRLERISHFEGGNIQVLDWGMNLLAIAMINDHESDTSKDSAEGRNNPIAAGDWDAEALRTELKKQLPDFQDTRLEELGQSVILQSFWIS